MDKGKKQIVYDEEEEEPVQIDGGNEVIDDAISLCLLGKLWTDRPYNTYGLMETMKKLWSPSKGMICRDMGANMISFQFHSKRDMDRVLGMEPWHFNKHILVLNKISNDIQPSMMKFSRTPFWMRLYDVPMRGRGEATIRQIGGRFGEVVEIDETTTNGIARSIRVKILLDLDKPLKRGTKVRVGIDEPCWIPVTYERLPSFCYWCGLLGHTYKDCDRLFEKEETDGKIVEEQLPFGEWMKASPLKIVQITPDRGVEAKWDRRRNLFPRDNMVTENAQDHEEADTGSKSLQKDSEQIDILLQSLEKCEVGKKCELHGKYSSRLPTHKSGNDITSMPNRVLPTKPNTPPPITNPNQNTHQIPYNTIPYTPTETLIRMVENQTGVPYRPLSKAFTLPAYKPTPPNNPILPEKPPVGDPKPTITSMPNLPVHRNNDPGLISLEPKPNTKTIPEKNHILIPPQAIIKTEPLSPPKIIPPKPPHTSDTTRTWKRQQGSRPKNKQMVIRKNSKRKDDQMDIDSMDGGDLKKPKSTTEDTFMQTAATAAQSRRTL